MRTRRNIFLLLAGLLGLVLVLSVVLYFSAAKLINADSVKEKIHAYLLGKIDADITYGRSEIHLFPIPEIIFHQVRLSMPGKAEGSVESLNAFPSLWPLMKGEVWIAKLSLEEPRFKVTISGGGEKSSPEEIEKNIRSAARYLASASPGLRIVIRDGKLDLTEEGKAAFSFDLIQSRLSVSRDIIDVELTGSSNFCDDLSISSSIKAEDLKSKGTIRLTHLRPNFLIARFLKERAGQIEISDLDLSIKFETSGLKVVNASMESSVSGLAVTRGGKRVTMGDAKIEGDIGVTRDAVSVRIKEAKISRPSLNLSGQYILGRNSGIMKFDLEGKSIPVQPVRAYALDLGGEIPLINTIFTVLRSGEIPALQIHTEGKSLTELMLTENIKISGQMRNGIIYVSPQDLTFRNVAGNVSISRGILDADNVGASIENHRGSRGKLRIGLKGKDAPFHLDMRVKADMEQLPSLLKHKNLLKNEAVLHEIDRIRDLRGSAEGRLILGERLDSIRVKIAVDDMNIMARYEPLPFPLAVTKGQFFFDEKTVGLTGTEGSLGGSSFSGLTARLSFTDSSAIRSIDLSLNGEIEPEVSAWLMSLFNLPPEMKIRAPFSVTDAILSIEKERKTAFSGRFLFAQETQVSLNVTKTPDSMTIRDLTVKDRGRDLDADVVLSNGNIDASFKGSLASQTLHAIFADSIYSDASIEGAFNTHIVIEHPRQSTAEGRLKAENIPIPWNRDIPLIARHIELEAKEEGVVIDTAELAAGDMTFKAQGTLASLPEWFAVDMDISSNGIEWETFENILRNKEHEVTGEKAGSLKDFPVRGSLRLRSDFFRYKQVRWEPFHADASFDGKTLLITANKAAICSVSTTGSVGITEEGLKIDVALSAKDLAFEPTVLCLTDKNTDFTGTFQMQAHLKGEGKFNELADKLGGGFTLSAKDGKILKFKQLDKTFDLLNESENFKGQFPDLDREHVSYKALDMRGTVRGLRIQIEEGMLEASVLRIMVRGYLDLSNETLDLNAFVSSLKTVNRVVKSIPVIGDVMGENLVSIPVRISGKMKEPKLTFLSPSAIGSGTLGVLERTIKLPVTLMEPIFPAKSDK